MKKDNKFFSDFAKIATSAFATASSIQREVAEYTKQSFENLAKRMNFVTKDEVDILKKIIMQLKKDVHELKKGVKVETDSNTQVNTPNQDTRQTGTKSNSKDK